MAKEKTVKLRAKAHIDFGDRQIEPGKKFDCPESEVERLLSLDAAEEIVPEDDEEASKDKGKGNKDQGNEGGKKGEGNPPSDPPKDPPQDPPKD